MDEDEYGYDDYNLSDNKTEFSYEDNSDTTFTTTTTTTTTTTGTPTTPLPIILLKGKKKI